MASNFPTGAAGGTLKWLTEHLPSASGSPANSTQGVARPIDSKDPEFLYLYGRALMLTGNHKDAIQAFELALANQTITLIKWTTGVLIHRPIAQRVREEMRQHSDKSRSPNG